jgi:hypothetical protein
MVQFFIFIGKFQVFELVLGLKFALRHSRRLATRDLQECMILEGGPKGTYENLALCQRSTCKNRKMKNVPRVEESC